MVCLLKGRGEGERDGGRGRIEREGREENFSVLRSHGGSVRWCVYVCVGAATMQVKTH